MANALPPTFAGRDAEHQLIRDAWKAAITEAERRVVLLAGEPGIGKTSLSARVAHEAHAEGALVLYGRSDEDLAIPYQPWIEALGHLVDVVSESVLVDHVRERGPHLARLVPRLSDRAGVEAPTTGDGDSDRLAVFAAIADVLERVSAETPILVVLDDMHWADRQSLQLLRHIITASRETRLLVVGTFRDTDVASGDAMTELVRSTPRGNQSRIVRERLAKCPHGKAL